ncbi:DUF4357 domain-containing protein [Hymenobacter sp. BT186]|uniref:DUF4357 domain-containing protein n=1 Tax=Hymenobacter telluris TaxID=2816474 RepID=A0A939EVJ6_9BACT|nr:DUF4357 domain-containing protein [Hymenobacter telluris]MBO0357425.1 DUF4357 domain-containing protein [Hymenobacter telluris]MBW3373451.1 DUF4357 domain-containing protein [Hymenobacter norwichensis]
MIELLEDIRRRLLANEYKNEEHVRLSLVARIVQAVGWNIWNPTEVYTEFKATEKEDNTRVDVALFANNFAADTIFIECKGIGRIGDDLAKVERQLRDYNRNHSALFTIITDGQHWRFYFSLTSGEFNQKLFGRLNLLHDEPAETAAYFQEFLGWENILNGSARVAAENYLLLSRKERAMKDVLPEAEKRITQPPFPALPDALAALLAAKGLVVSREEATAFLAGEALPKPSAPVQVARSEAAALSATVVEAISAQVSELPTFYLQLKRSGISATAQWSDAERTKFVVKASSTAALEAKDSLSKGHRSLRQDLIQLNILVKNGDNLIFTKDYSFVSAGAAGDVICGYSVNGRTIWGDKKGRALGDY